ncbi:retrotransposon protein, putative, ty1-copia subclass [Tanacetum coccineum]
MENSKKGNLPLHHGIKISKDLCLKTNEELDKMSRVPYASAVGSIPCRHQQNPSEGHWTAVKNILKYLRNTKDMFLVYGGEEELRVTGYCDASWQTDKDDSRSQTVWVFLLNGGEVTWKSSKKDTVADSTCESDYIAACEASKEAIWMKNFIGDLGVVPIVQDPIEIFCDNKSAITLTKEPKDHRKSKQIKRKYHFIRSKVEEGHVIVKHIRSEDNPADPFTKALAKSKHDGLKNIGRLGRGYISLDSLMKSLDNALNLLYIRCYQSTGSSQLARKNGDIRFLQHIDPKRMNIFHSTMFKLDFLGLQLRSLVRTPRLQVAIFRHFLADPPDLLVVWSYFYVLAWLQLLD